MLALYFENCSSYLHETSYKYQSTLTDVQSARTITLAFILLRYFPLTQSQNRVHSNLKPVPDIFKETLCKYQSTLDNVQSTRTITLAFILFEFFAWNFVSHKKHIHSIT